jgi:predicted RNA binding protein YcfA (HicA-like mRNA interferase family)
MGNHNLSHCHTAREIESYLSHRGATCVRQTGSHAIWKGQQGGPIVIPCHNGDLPRGTLGSIVKMILIAGLGILLLTCLIVANLPMIVR